MVRCVAEAIPVTRRDAARGSSRTDRTDELTSPRRGDRPSAHGWKPGVGWHGACVMNGFVAATVVRADLL